jgi:hypothetical protein
VARCNSTWMTNQTWMPFLAFFSSYHLGKYAFWPRAPWYGQASPPASRHSRATRIRLPSIKEVCTHFCFLLLKTKKAEGTIGNGCIPERTDNLCFIHLGLPYLQNKRSINETTTTTPPRHSEGHRQTRKEQAMPVSPRP